MKNPHEKVGANDIEKKIYTYCTDLSQKILIRAKQFFMCEKKEVDNRLQEYDEENATNAKYMHRGYYCPSRMQEHIFDNVKRGKIVTKPTKRTKISHKYYYHDNKLRAIDSYLTDNNSDFEREYLIYEGDVIYGVTIDLQNNIVGLSAEILSNRVLITYLFASCYVNTCKNIDLGIDYMFMEHFDYESTNRCTGTFAYIIPHDSQSKEDWQAISLVDYSQLELQLDTNSNKWKKTD